MRVRVPVPACVGRGAVVGCAPRLRLRLRRTHGARSVGPGGHAGAVALQNFTNAWFDAHIGTAAWQAVAASFVEQRGYVDAAVAALRDLPLRRTIEAALDASRPRRPARSPAQRGYMPLSLPSTQQCAHLSLRLDARGAVIGLVDRRTGRVWATPANPLGLLHYTTHSEDEFRDFITRYMQPMCAVRCDGCGFAKCRLNDAGAVAADYAPSLLADGAWVLADAAGTACSFELHLTFPQRIQQLFGAPGDVILTLNVSADALDQQQITVDLQWFDKRPTRMAESIWMTFNPVAPDPSRWRLHKMGEWISPYDGACHAPRRSRSPTAAVPTAAAPPHRRTAWRSDLVVVNGSRSLHAVWKGVRYEGADGAAPLLSIDTLDAPVVAPGRASPILFLQDEQPEVERGMSFCLFNNLWNTNCAMRALGGGADAGGSSACRAPGRRSDLDTRSVRSLSFRGDHPLSCAARRVAGETRQRV